MISEPYGAILCFVYMHLPGQPHAVTAGQFRLLHTKQGVVMAHFVYGRRYLANPDAVEIDPIELKLNTAVYETAAGGGVFGALRDAGPDHWGRLVIERYAGRPELGEIDYLLCSPEDRAGALGFGLNKTPPPPLVRYNQTLDLAKLQTMADALEEARPQRTATVSPSLMQVEDLLLLGTSMGGARPKVVVEDQDDLWLVKFNRGDDPWNYARVEHAMLTLGRACGLSTAQGRVISIAGRDALAVRRFDRDKIVEGYARARMLSAFTLLRLSDTLRSRDRWSYLLLAEALRKISDRPEADLAQLFRRMCFNALISNIDDHPRNHAVIAHRSWGLSPAYDLTPSVPVSLERRDLAMTCGAMGRWACKVNLMSQADRFLLGQQDASHILTSMTQQVGSTWRSVARGCGVTPADCDSIAGAFVYPGFHLP